MASIKEAFGGAVDHILGERALARAAGPRDRAQHAERDRDVVDPQVVLTDAGDRDRGVASRRRFAGAWLNFLVGAGIGHFGTPVPLTWLASVACLLLSPLGVETKGPSRGKSWATRSTLWRIESLADPYWVRSTNRQRHSPCRRHLTCSYCRRPS